MKLFISLATLTIFIISCTQQSGHSKIIVKKIDRHWLDSIIKKSDSSYAKSYKRIDFVTAVFYLNKKDSSVCQIMKDSADSIRQIIIAKKEIRTFFAQYYTNGQLQAALPLDEFGQNHGPTAFYYEDGRVQSSGDYMHGLKSGQWKFFDTKGTLIYTGHYNETGQLVNTISK